MEKNKQNKAHDTKVVIVCSALAFIIFTIDSIIPLGVAGGVPYVLIVLVSLWAVNAKMPVYMAIAGSALTIVGYYSSPSGGELWKVMFNRSLALFAIWSVAILSIQRKAVEFEKEKALSEVKILRGLLPICAACKKIRDDQGYWSQIELFITDRSEAQFSHGICPDCVEKLYPEYAAKKKQT